MAAVAEEAAGEVTEAEPADTGREIKYGSGPDRPSRRAGWLRMPGLTGRRALAGAFALVVIVLVAGSGGYVLNSGGGDADTEVIAGTSTDGSEVVLVTDGESGTLRISDLDRPAPGDVYQAWVRRGDRIEATDSLFLPRSDGTAAAAIPDLEGASEVMVSTEPAGGSRAPTTVPVISVPLDS